MIEAEEQNLLQKYGFISVEYLGTVVKLLESGGGGQRPPVVTAVPVSNIQLFHLQGGNGKIEVK